MEVEMTNKEKERILEILNREVDILGKCKFSEMISIGTYLDTLDEIRAVVEGDSDDEY
jgi:hypothetical protein